MLGGQRLLRQIDFQFCKCNMYFIAYVIGAREHMIIPIQWVNDHKIVLEKSIKYAINSNQTHLCYFSAQIVENGRVNQKPNFHLPIERAIPFDGECCFHVLLVSFFSK